MDHIIEGFNLELEKIAGDVIDITPYLTGKKVRPMSFTQSMMGPQTLVEKKTPKSLWGKHPKTNKTLAALLALGLTYHAGKESGFLEGVKKEQGILDQKMREDYKAKLNRKRYRS